MDIVATGATLALTDDKGNVNKSDMPIMKYGQLAAMMTIALLSSCDRREKMKSDAIVLASVHDVARNRKLLWEISEDRFKALPKYNDDFRIDLASAIKIAKAKIEKRHPESKIKLAEASFRQPAEGDAWIGVFFYFISFEVVEKRAESWTDDVLVLPDMAILDPREIALAPKGG